MSREVNILHSIYKDLEVWKPIPETNGMYEASSWGNIRSTDRVVFHPNQKLLKLKGKLLKKTASNEKYFYVTICIGGKRRKHNVHTLVASVFLGPRPAGYHIDHGDRNRQNNHMKNLSYKTVYENCSFKGSQSANAKLTEAQVAEIKAKYKHRIYTTIMLSKEYNVDPTTVHKITSGINWKHIQPAKL